MSDNRNTVIVGYGGHAFSVIDAYNEMGKGIKYYTSIKEIEINPFKLEYLGFELDLNFAGWGKDLSYILGNLKYLMALKKRKMGSKFCRYKKKF